MEVIETELQGCLLITNRIFKDERGNFRQTYSKKEFFSHTGLDIDFVQDNLSFSKKGVLRGLHFQTPPYEQAKLIQVIKGRVLDVIVDLRAESETFGKFICLTLDADDSKSVFIPKGMAHGFLTLSDEVCFHYKCDEFYRPDAESGIAYDDQDLNIDWGYRKEEIILSEKDKKLPSFKSFLK
ncbi:MAG: dTDP-4-dehydrorhamnose 3,5-epimerase [Allomuricauda sp.]|nr:MAG: dTDP-4-dehydrorhamnose 3,5-epimerase [Allomuricauda sp.]